jgi:hypothetical protein
VSDSSFRLSYGGGLRVVAYTERGGRIRLMSDVARVFSTSEAVNEVLRALLPVIRARKRAGNSRKGGSGR